jgi:Cft2 family RNA processing exonuclease
MARTRTTPYPAQLDRLLNSADRGARVFSALTLADEFEHPLRQKPTTTIGAVHRALHRAWGDGKVIAFIDADRNVLREAAFGAPGSAAVEHPQVFATPGTPPPREGFTAVTYPEYAAFRAGADDDLDAAGDEEFDAADGPGDEEAIDSEPLSRDALIDAIGEAAASTFPDEMLDGLVADDLPSVILAVKLRNFDPKDPAPAWLPSDVLCRWVTLPLAVSHWKAGLDRADAVTKTRLIRAGVRRKGGILPESLTARGLAQLVREDAHNWGVVCDLAIRHYSAAGDIPPIDELVELDADPVGFYLDSDYPPDAVLLTGMAIGLEDAALQEIAADVAGATGVGKPTAEEELRFQLSGRDAEISELRSQLKAQTTTANAARKEQQNLRAEVDRLRAAAEQQAGSDEELNAQRARADEALVLVAELEAQLDAANEQAANAEDLVGQVQALESLRDELLAGAPSVERERRLREEAEAEVQAQLRRVRELSQRLRDVAGSAVEIPVQDGPSLIAALAGPVSAAAQHALERMATHTPIVGDAQLLRFAATFAQLADEAPVRAPALSDGVQADAAEAQLAEPPVAETPAPATADLPAGDEPGAEHPPSPEPAAELRAEVAAEPALPAERRRTRRRAMPFTIRPIGGASEVGGSAIVVQARNGSTVLLDAGQRVKGEFGAESVNQFHYGVPGTDRLDAILISHAHIDHIGSLPLIHQHHSELAGHAIPVLMSEPTHTLGEIMLNDSAKIQHYREQALSAIAESDYGAGAMEAAYSFPDVKACLDSGHVVIADQHKPIPIEGTSFVARFLPVAHVLGSCAIHLKDTDTGATLLYSGDLGPLSEPQLTLPDFGGTQMIEGADVVIMESTYGLLSEEEREGRRRARHGRERATQILADVAGKTMSDGGHMLLPAFSLGRTQEIAMLIAHERGRSMPDGKIYIAGMGEKITTVYDAFDRPKGGWRRSGEFPQTTSVQRWLDGGGFEDVVSEVLESQSGYIIASPAMVSSGWSRAFMHAMLDEPGHAIVFTGYLPRHAGNIANLREMHTGATMRLDGENRAIRCRWEKVGLSAHAPSSDLEQFARDVTAGRDSVHIGVVHGQPEAQRELAERLTHLLEHATVRSLRNGEPWVPGRS